MENWEVIKTKVLKQPTGAEKSKRERTEGNVRVGATAGVTAQKGRGVRVIEGKVGDDPIEYFLPTSV